MRQAINSELDTIASPMRFYLQVQGVGDAGIHRYANEIFKLAKKGYSQENLKSEIWGLQVNGIRQPLDLVVCGKVATVALDVVAGWSGSGTGK